MAVRDDFTAGEVLAAADLNDTFASKPPFAYGTATPSTTVEGFIWYDENDTPPAPKFWDGSAFETFGGGKVLQIVRATDATGRSTSSATFVDASLSVTITPTKSDSTLILLATYRTLINQSSAGPAFGEMQITDSSNNAVSGAEALQLGGTNSSNPRIPVVLVGYATPAVITAVTYKVRFRKINGTDLSLENNVHTAQMFAIEVSA
jgi:hypothetical protein